MTLETMQKEGREQLDEMHHSRTVPVSRSEQHKLSDQHTANTWNEARESLLVDMKREMKSWSGTGTAMIKDYETKARDYD